MYRDGGTRERRVMLQRIAKSAMRLISRRVYVALQRRFTLYARLMRRVAAAQGYAVATGPFAGMEYFGQGAFPRVDQRPIPKMLGSFEEELHAWLDALIRQGFETIVNIGAGEGYYAVGMALRLPRARVVAFETVPAVRATCLELAKINNVSERIEVRAACDVSSLATIPLVGALVICDIEGGEVDVIEPADVPQLREAVIVVELHDCFREGATATLVSRFANTHSIEMRTTVSREADRYPALNGFSKREQSLCLDEHRVIDGVDVAQSWMLLRPNSDGTQENRQG